MWTMLMLAQVSELNWFVMPTFFLKVFSVLRDVNLNTFKKVLLLYLFFGICGQVTIRKNIMKLKGQQIKHKILSFKKRFEDLK